MAAVMGDIPTVPQMPAIRSSAPPGTSTRQSWRDAHWAQMGNGGYLSSLSRPSIAEGVDAEATRRLPVTALPRRPQPGQSPRYPELEGGPLGPGFWASFLEITGVGMLSPRIRAELPYKLAVQLWRRLAVFMVALTILLTVLGAVDAVSRISRARADVEAGMSHLRALQALVPAQKDVGSLLSGSGLARLQQELSTAERDFGDARTQLTFPLSALVVADHAPGAGNELDTATSLVVAADEATLAGLDLVRAVPIITGALKGGLFAEQATPGPQATPSPQRTSAASAQTGGLNAATLSKLQRLLDSATSHLRAAVTAARTADLSTLPPSLVKPKQVAQLRQVLANWPSIADKLAQVHTWLQLAPELLGASAPTSYLLEMMDRGELRPSGGFIGNYAVLTINNGQVQPFSLADVYLLDTPFLLAHNRVFPVPAAYPWFPWPAFALRDSNLSGDFPTSAQLGMKQFAIEGGPQVRGVIAFTAPAIARILKVTGPITVPDYKETVTADNLERIIHYYQETTAFRLSNAPPPTDQISSRRKRFTALLARELMQRLRTLPQDKLFALMQEELNALRSKDIQAYFDNATAEGLLTQNRLDGALIRGPSDGVTVIEANVTPNKANEFITVTQSDNVVLDARGTATHNLTVALNFHLTDPSQLYGPAQYKDYLRLYVSPNARLTHQEGLNNALGADQINRSDEAGRQMWGGYVFVNDGQITTLHFTWKVPNAATQDAAGRWHYAVTYQRQAGNTETLHLTITPPGLKAPLTTYNGYIDSDRTFSASYP